MKITGFIYPVLLVFALSACSGENGAVKGDNDSMQMINKSKTGGAYVTGKYLNLFTLLLGKSEQEVNARVESAFNQLFYGSDSTQRLYFPVEPDMAYIQDVLQKDVRTEGKSYGMMIAVQLNKKEEFDRLWKWAKTYLQHKDGHRKDYFSWKARPDGEILDSNSATDGEEWYVMSLFFASARWGDGVGIFNYRAEAQKILDAMLEKTGPSTVRILLPACSIKRKNKLFFPR